MALDQVMVAGDQWEPVAASKTAYVLGGGKTNGYLSHLVITPETTSPGAVSIVDGSAATNIVFAGGASSVSNLVPFVVPIGATAQANWRVTTGTNVHVIAVGRW